VAKKPPGMISTIVCVSMLAIAWPGGVQAQVDFVTLESRYYDSVDTLRLLAGYVEGAGFIGWIPKAEEPSHGLLYLVPVTQYAGGNQFAPPNKISTLHLANEHYCGLREQLTQKAAPPLGQELPRCYVVALQDALKDLATTQSLLELRLKLTDLNHRVEQLEQRKK
jgi:hypothetical protein